MGLVERGDGLDLDQGFGAGQVADADQSAGGEVAFEDLAAQADELVTELMEQLAQTFQQERRSLESELDRDDVSTEDLRVALKRYRSFFERLLAT